MLKSKKIWGFIVSIFFLWLALRKVDWSSIPDILSEIDYSFILLMCFTYTLEHLARAYRWRSILPGKYLKIKFAYFGIVLGYLFNNLLPARAGEFVRSFYLKKKKTAPATEVFGSVVFERFLDGLVIITLIVFSLNYFPSTDLVKQAGLSAIVFYLVILVVIVLLQFKRNLVLRFTRKIFSAFPAKVAEFLHNSEESFINGLGLIARPKKFFRALLLSIVSWALSILTMYICLKMFNLDMGVAEAILLICVLSIGSMIPTSPGMIGIYEYCCVLALHDVLGKSEEVAVMFGVVSHTVGYFYVLIAGFIILGVENLSIHDLSHAREKIET